MTSKKKKKKKKKKKRSTATTSVLQKLRHFSEYPLKNKVREKKKSLNTHGINFGKLGQILKGSKFCIQTFRTCWTKLDENKMTFFLLFPEIVIFIRVI